MPGPIRLGGIFVHLRRTLSAPVGSQKSGLRPPGSLIPCNSKLAYPTVMLPLNRFILWRMVVLSAMSCSGESGDSCELNTTLSRGLQLFINHLRSYHQVTLDRQMNIYQREPTAQANHPPARDQRSPQIDQLSVGSPLPLYLFLSHPLHPLVICGRYAAPASSKFHTSSVESDG